MRISITWLRLSIVTGMFTVHRAILILYSLKKSWVEHVDGITGTEQSFSNDPPAPLFGQLLRWTQFIIVIIIYSLQMKTLGETLTLAGFQVFQIYLSIYLSLQFANLHCSVAWILSKWQAALSRACSGRGLDLWPCYHRCLLPIVFKPTYTGSYFEGPMSIVHRKKSIAFDIFM